MPSTTSVVLITLSIINASFPVWRVYSPMNGDALHARAYNDNQNYSYVGSDYPFYHPTLALKPASLTLQESVHYGYNTTSDPDSAKEWHQLVGTTDWTGLIHLGPNHRSFLLTFYHQLHCIVMLKEALVNRAHSWANAHHVNHCLQYLRESFLCQADDQIEEGDFMGRNFETDRLGPDIECMDWENVYQQIGAQWLVFAEWKKYIDTM